MSAIGLPTPGAGSWTHDDRIVLPLSRVREAASLLCNRLCRERQRHMSGPDWVWPPPPHDESCLVPDIEQRDGLMAEQADYSDKISPDCQVGGAKCQACTGCIHDCHRPFRGEFTNRTSVPPRGTT